MTFAIFIVGTGRSGTHFTCRTLAGFKNVLDPHGGKEYGAILRPIATAAIQHQEYPRAAIDYYNEIKARFKSSNKVFIDQHHPNLFFSEHILEIFENAIFVYPERPVEQVVASMMTHSGVMGWYRYARDSQKSSPIPLPNQFLGIEQFSQLDLLPIHILCALRVIAHKRKSIELFRKHSSRCRFVDFGNLVRSQEAAIKSIFTEDELSCLGDFTSTETPKIDSLTKFVDVLSDEQANEIKLLVKSKLEGL